MEIKGKVKLSYTNHSPYLIVEENGKETYIDALFNRLLGKEITIICKELYDETDNK